MGWTCQMSKTCFHRCVQSCGMRRPTGNYLPASNTTIHGIAIAGPGCAARRCMSEGASWSGCGHVTGNPLTTDFLAKELSDLPLPDWGDLHTLRLPQEAAAGHVVHPFPSQVACPTAVASCGAAVTEPAQGNRPPDRLSGSGISPTGDKPVRSDRPILLVNPPLRTWAGGSAKTVVETIVACDPGDVMSHDLDGGRLLTLRRFSMFLFVLGTALNFFEVFGGMVHFNHIQADAPCKALIMLSVWFGTCRSRLQRTGTPHTGHGPREHPLPASGHTGCGGSVVGADDLLSAGPDKAMVVAASCPSCAHQSQCGIPPPDGGGLQPYASASAGVSARECRSGRFARPCCYSIYTSISTWICAVASSTLLPWTSHVRSGCVLPDAVHFLGNFHQLSTLILVLHTQAGSHAGCVGVLGTV